MEFDSIPKLNFKGGISKNAYSAPNIVSFLNAACGMGQTNPDTHRMGKSQRVKYKTLQLKKEYGGMGLPCLEEYYYAAQLRPPICLCNSDYFTR